ncbi:hypothetical protein BY996DRAFT_2462150 [Phakopsora pachyrhizi]|nr:hypothetical protein BY996DRAFT_2462150 [Phakopsora pachyrhizi]
MLEKILPHAVGIMNSWIFSHPCSIGLLQLAHQVKKSHFIKDDWADHELRLMSLKSPQMKEEEEVKIKRRRMSLNQTDQNQIRVRTDQKQQERFKTSSNNLNDSSNRRSMKCLKCLRNESDRQTDWIDCKKCSNLYHWCCVSKNILDPIDIVDKVSVRRKIFYKI